MFVWVLTSTKTAIFVELPCHFYYLPHLSDNLRPPRTLLCPKTLYPAARTWGPFFCGSRKDTFLYKYFAIQT